MTRTVVTRQKQCKQTSCIKWCLHCYKSKEDCFTEEKLQSKHAEGAWWCTLARWYCSKRGLWTAHRGKPWTAVLLSRCECVKLHERFFLIKTSDFDKWALDNDTGFMQRCKDKNVKEQAQPRKCLFPSVVSHKKPVKSYLSRISFSFVVSVSTFWENAQLIVCEKACDCQHGGLYVSWRMAGAGSGREAASPSL